MQQLLKQDYTLTIYTENQVGLINKIAIIFSKRKLNIESFNSSPSEVKGIFRFTMVIHETEAVVKKVCKQIEKQIDILRAYYNTDDEIIWQEMALYKMPTSVTTEHIKVERLLRQHGARAVVIRNDYTIFEATGQREETDNLLAVLQPLGLIEFVRSARIAIIKNSDGLHSKVLNFEAKQPSDDTSTNEFLNDQDEVFTM